MSVEIKWLNIALSNLNKEAEYIAKENPLAAQLMVKRIINAVNALAENPACGRPGRLPDTRELVVPNSCYIVPYRVRPQSQRIEILRIFHTSRPLPQRW
jgi:toxin ParE1/3/4